MKSVLISIQPKWCGLIASGKKTIEVRKTKPKLKPPFKCYIYCTLKGSNEFFKENLNGDVAKWNREKWDYRKGKVIGEFVCDDIETLHSNAVVNAPALYSQSCMTREEFFKYAGDVTVYFWRISDFNIYDEPKELSNFTGLRETKFGAEPIEIIRPPQSWYYVEERSKDNE